MRCAVLFLLCGICPVFGADLKVLSGHVPKIISSLAPKGRLAATNELWLAIGLPLRDRAGLENLVAQVSDPASPNFRHFLTREELTARFGPTAQDYEAVKTFARTNGLAITVTHDNRLLLDVTGPAAAVEKAFHITLRTYRHPTEARDFFAPDTEPMVDAALPVLDILGLSDYSRPHPKFVSRTNNNAATVAPKNGTAPDGSGNLFGNDFRNAYVPQALTLVTSARAKAWGCWSSTGILPGRYLQLCKSGGKRAHEHYYRNRFAGRLQRHAVLDEHQRR